MEGVEPRACGHGLGSPGPGVSCEQVHVPACNAVQFSGEEGALAWEAGDPAFRPSSSFTCGDETQTFRNLFPSALNGDRKASQGFLVGDGERKVLNTRERVSESTEH